MAEEGNSAASNAIWAIVVLLIVVLVLGFIYMTGVFTQKKEIDINIQKPGIVLPVSTVKHLRL